MRYKHKNLKKATILKEVTQYTKYIVKCPYCEGESRGYFDKHSVVVECPNCHKFFELDWAKESE